VLIRKKKIEERKGEKGERDFLQKEKYQQTYAWWIFWDYVLSSLVQQDYCPEVIKTPLMRGRGEGKGIGCYFIKGRIPKQDGRGEKK